MDLIHRVGNSGGKKTFSVTILAVYLLFCFVENLPKTRTFLCSKKFLMSRHTKLWSCNVTY